MTYEEYDILISALYFYREYDRISRREFIAGVRALNIAYNGPVECNEDSPLTYKESTEFVRLIDNDE